MKTFSINEATTEAAFKAAGFSELRAIFQDKSTLTLSSNDIRKSLMKDYNFTEGQASGTIRRACDKQLLFAAGNAEYIFNIDFPHAVADYITGKNNFPHDEESIFENENKTNHINDIKNEIIDLINNVAKGINISEVSVEDLILFRETLIKMKECVLNDSINLNTDTICSNFSNIKYTTLPTMVADTIQSYVHGLEEELNILDMTEEEMLEIHEMLSSLLTISKIFKTP